MLIINDLCTKLINKVKKFKEKLQDNKIKKRSKWQEMLHFHALVNEYLKKNYWSIGDHRLKIISV